MRTTRNKCKFVCEATFVSFFIFARYNSRYSTTFGNISKSDSAYSDSERRCNTLLEKQSQIAFYANYKYKNYSRVGCRKIRRRLPCLTFPSLFISPSFAYTHTLTWRNNCWSFLFFFILFLKVKQFSFSLSFFIWLCFAIEGEVSR